MATLQDIADVVGVSTVTVSKVLRGKVKGSWPRSAAQVKRIREVADELGYRVDWRARALKTKRTQMIGLLSTDKPETRTHDHDLLNGLIETFGAEGYHLVFVRVGKGSRGRDFADARFDGLIIDYHLEPEELEIIQQAELPAVIINASGPKGTVSVIPDHRQAGRLVAEHLLGLGHRRIAYVQSSTVMQRRWPGHVHLQWRKGLMEAIRGGGSRGELIDIIPEVVRGQEKSNCYQSIFADLMDSGDQPTAFVALNAPMAVERVTRILEQLGLSCPADFSVVAMEDHDSLDWHRPGITAARIPYADLGQQAAQRLLYQIDSRRGFDLVPKSTLVSELIVRQSTGPYLPSRCP